MKTIAGSAPYATIPGRFFTPVTAKAVIDNPYRWPRPASHVELKIGRGRGKARIVRLKSRDAYQLALDLIEGAKKVAVNLAEEKAWDKGQSEGYKNGLREARKKKHG